MNNENKKKWIMKNKKWKMLNKNKKWIIKNRKWRTKKQEWKTKNEIQKTRNKKWKMKYEKRNQGWHPTHPPRDSRSGHFGFSRRYGVAGGTHAASCDRVVLVFNSETFDLLLGKTYYNLLMFYAKFHFHWNWAIWWAWKSDLQIILILLGTWIHEYKFYWQ